MAQTVLGSLSLGYQFLWNPLRQPAAIQLFIEADAALPPDARHLLAALRELWSEQAPPLLLSIPSAQLLSDVLEHGTSDSPWVEVPQAWLDDPDNAQRARLASERGLQLVWRGEPGQRPALAEHCLDQQGAWATAGCPCPNAS